MFMRLTLSALFFGLPCVATAAEPIEIGDRLELFVDNHVIDEITGGAKLHLHKPVPKEVVLTTDQPWEGNTSAYYTVFPDGDLFRMYYRGSHYDVKTKKQTHPQVACYAESTDGIHWTKPELGIVEFEGSKANSIVWIGEGSHNFTPFKDTNPDCAPDARYKAFGSGKLGGKYGLIAFKSADAVHWQIIGEAPVITKGAFDSQNLAFWDTVRGTYIDFHRQGRDGVRDIMTATSSDFKTWTEPVFLEYTGAPKQHLYTNAIMAYPRAPNILIGFPTRFHPERNSQVEPTLMSSRDGRTFHRWPEALIPVTAPEDRDGNRSNYMAWGLLKLPSSDKEYSVYGSEAYYTGPDSRLRRFVYRVDGFVSVQATDAGGQLLTKPLKFTGDKLVINFTTNAGGSLRAQVQDAQGNAADGFALADCAELKGDAIEQTVTWKGSASLGDLAGKPIRLVFELKDADLFSFRFAK
jgi:hypothetical protein